MIPWESEHGASLLSKDCKVSYTVLVHIGQVRFGLEGTYVSHLADESNRSCLLDLMSTVQVSSTSADTGVHKVLPSRGKPGLPRATGPRMLCRSAEACDSYECVRIVAIIHMASKLLLLPTVWCKQWVILHSFSDNEVFRMFSEIKRWIMAGLRSCFRHGLILRDWTAFHPSIDEWWIWTWSLVIWRVVGQLMLWTSFCGCIFAMNQLRRISDIAALYIEWCAADIGVVVGSGCLSQVFCATEARWRWANVLWLTSRN